MSLYVPHDSGDCGGQKKALNPLELDLQGVVNHLSWVLGSESGSSVKAASVLIHSAMSPAPEARAQLSVC